MTKRRLSLRQQRRILAGQSRGFEAGMIADAGEAGLRTGVVSARYGREVDVLDAAAPHAPAQRCHLRANLEPVVGDRVLWQSGDPQGVVSALAPRRSLLRRRENRRVRILAANVDQVAIVIAPRPQPHPALVDRFLAAAELEGIEALLILNKCDLPDTGPAEAIGAARARLGYPLVRVSARNGLGLENLRSHLERNISVFCGQSGVGKSSLINRLFPDAGAAVGALSEAAAKGRHTTTIARFYPLPGGAVIDAPGIREFDVACADAHELIHGFVELLPLAAECRFRNCRHLDDPGCALAAAVREGAIDPQRLASFHHLRNQI
ncbi:MAG: ribosome small subunit-dependent GTPase A [Pseudomonadota bacterium]